MKLFLAVLLVALPCWTQGQVDEAPPPPSALQAVTGMQITMHWQATDPNTWGWKIYSTTDFLHWTWVDSTPWNQLSWRTNINRFEPSRFYAVTATNFYGESAALSP